MDTYFTADTHFNHGNILKYCQRPWLSEEEKELLRRHENFKVSQASVARQDDALIDAINKTVGEDDELWHLGDFVFARKHEVFAKAKYYRDRINCKNVHLIWGNHDDYAITSLFDSTEHYRMIRINHQKIVLCHYAFAVWNGSHKGVWNLYGHSHRSAEPWLDMYMPGRRAIDVGVDNAAAVLGEYRPFSFKEIERIMSARKGHSVDHHDHKKHKRQIH